LKAADLMLNLATVLDSMGNLSDALTLMEEALEIQVKFHGKNSIETAVTMNNLGVLQAHLGDLHKAEKLLELAVTVS
jgi:Flp pilus assembly protein TadD